MISTNRAVTIVAALSITLLRLPVYLGYQNVLQPAVIGVFVLCIAWAIPRQPPRSVATWPAATALALAGIWAVTRLRGEGLVESTSAAASGGLAYVCLVVFGIVLVTTARTPAELNHRLIAIAAAPAIYATTNVVMHLAGLVSPLAGGPGGLAAGRPAELLQLVGVSMSRVQFPTASSVNLFSIVAAAGAVAIIVIGSRERRTQQRFLPRWAPPAAAAIGLFVMVASDSRAILVIAVAVVAVARFNRDLRGSAGVAYLLPFMPIIVVGAFAVLASTGVISEVFSRGNATDAATGVGRTYIWDGIWQELQNLSGPTLYGWGAAGQIQSGATMHYAYLFGLNPGATTVPAHSTTLQVLLDAGVTGLALLVAAATNTLRLLSRAARDPRLTGALGLVAGVIVILLAGATEVSVTYYADESLSFLLLAAGAAAGYRSREVRTDAFARTDPSTARPVTAKPAEINDEIEEARPGAVRWDAVT